MTEIKYPQITQITQISLWDERRPGVEEVRRYRSYPLAQTILPGAHCHFVLLRSLQCLEEVRESFGATYDLWPYPKPLKKSA
jgi:hypothetical protein